MSRAVGFQGRSELIMPEITPTKIRINRPARSLDFEWSDGRSSSLAWDLLRSRCPSAGETVARESKAERGNPLAVLKAIPSAELTDVRLTGRYAVALTWADGHSAGIYSWPFLRSLADEQVQKIGDDQTPTK
jgi:DUF971 family protein